MEKWCFKHEMYTHRGVYELMISGVRYEEWRDLIWGTSVTIGIEMVLLHNNLKIYQVIKVHNKYCLKSMTGY